MLPQTGNSMAVASPTRQSPNSTEPNGGTPAPLHLEQFKAVMLYLADVHTLSPVPVDTLYKKITALLNYVDGGAPFSFTVSRFRVVMQYDGLLVVVSALAHIITLGPEYEECLLRLMGFLLMVEMTSDLVPRPARPMGILTILKSQITLASRTLNRHLALSLLGKYNQHDETMHFAISKMALVAPIAKWLFSEATPAVVCSTSILSAIEDSEGSAQLRAVPNISRRIFELLSWTSTLSVVSSALAILPHLDRKEMIMLGVIPELLSVLRSAMAAGVTSLALMALTSLDIFISTSQSYISPSSTPPPPQSSSYSSHNSHFSSPTILPCADIVTEVLTTLRGLEKSHQSRHMIKSLLTVLKSSFREKNVGAPNALSSCRHFRALGGPALLQEFIAALDHSRRLSQTEAESEIEFILNPDDLGEMAQTSDNSEENTSNRMDIDKTGDDQSTNGRNLTSEELFERRLPPSAPGALVQSSSNNTYSTNSGASQDQLDLVIDLYRTLNDSNSDYFSSEVSDVNESSYDEYASDLFWVPLSIIHHIREAELVCTELNYLSTLFAIFAPPASRQQNQYGTTSSTTKSRSVISDSTTLRTHATLVKRLLSYLRPSWRSPQSLTAKIARGVGNNSHQQVGSDVTISCLSIASNILQHFQKTLNGSESSPVQDNIFSFATFIVSYIRDCIMEPDFDIDKLLFSHVFSCLTHVLVIPSPQSSSPLARLVQHNRIYSSCIHAPVQEIVHFLQTHFSQLNYAELDLELEWLTLKALVATTTSEIDPEKAEFDLAALNLKVPELVLPGQPLRHWSSSLAPLVPLINSGNANIALLGLLDLSSFIVTPRGRSSFDAFVSAHAASITAAKSKSITNDMFWNRIVHISDMYPSR